MASVQDGEESGPSKWAKLVTRDEEMPSTSSSILNVKTSRVIEQGDDTHEIAKIMAEDTELTEKREQFSRALGLTGADVIDLKRMVKAEVSTSSYIWFVSSLSTWISRSGSPVTISDLMEKLLANDFSQAAAKICSHFGESLQSYGFENHAIPQSSGAKALRIFCVPNEAYNFTGRVEELDQIHESILKQSAGHETSATGLTVITAIKGMGGIGKTSLTIKYAWKYYKNSFYHTVLWIDSETAETLADSWRRLARKLSLNDKLQAQEIASEIYTSISTQRSLVIFDNVEKPKCIKNYLPQQCNVVRFRPGVLVTSRFQRWGLGANEIRLDVLSQDDAVDLILRFLGLTPTDADYAEGLKKAGEISCLLQRLPLALVQAGAYIIREEDSGTIVAKMKLYLELFNKNSAKLLSFKYFKETYDIYEKTVCSAWQITIDKLKRKNWLTEVILETIAYFAPDDIPIELLSKIPMADPDEQEGLLGVEVGLDLVEGSLKLLTSYSMVTRVEGADSISVHRLLQAVVKKGVEDRLGHSVLRRAMKMIRAIIESADFADVDKFDVYLSHAISVKNFRPSHEDSHKSLYDSFEELVYGSRYNSSVSCIRALGQLVDKSKYSEAAKVFETFKNKYFAVSIGPEIFERDRFVVDFINMLLCEIEELWDEGNSLDEVLKSLKYILDSNPIKYEPIYHNVHKIVEFTLSTSEECLKNNLLQIVFHVQNINFESAKAVVAENKYDERFEWFDVLESIAEILLKLKDFPRLLELFENTNSFFINLGFDSSCFNTPLEFDIGEFLLKNLLDYDDLTKKPVVDDLMDKSIALITTCPENCMERRKMRLIRTIINCLPETTNCTVNRGLALGEVRKFQRSLRSSPDPYMNFPSEVIEIADGLRDSRLSNGILGDINTNEFALFLYKEIYQRAKQNGGIESRASGTDHADSIVGILHCFDQLGSWEGIVSTITDFKVWLASSEPSSELYHFSKVSKFIYKLCNHQSCISRQKKLITEANNIFRKLRLALREKKGWHYANITKEYICLLISVGNFVEVFEILCDYKAWLGSSKQTYFERRLAVPSIVIEMKQSFYSDGNARLKCLEGSASGKQTHFKSRIAVPSIVMEMKISFSDHIRSKCLEVVDTIYTEIYMRCGRYLDQISEHRLRIDCLLELGKVQEIIPFLEPLQYCDVKSRYRIARLAFQTGLNPDYSGNKLEILQFALKICERQGLAPSIWLYFREILVVIDVLMELDESEKLLGYLDKLALLELADPNEFEFEFEVQLSKEFTDHLLNNANRPNISSPIRTKLYELLLKYSSARFRYVHERTVFWNYSYHYPKISQSALTMIKCLQVLDRPAEIVELIQKLKTIFKAYTDNLSNLPANFVWFSEIHEYLIEICTDPGDHELIQESLALRLIKYEFEKKTFSFVDMLNTVESIVASLVQLNRVDEILKMARDVQQVVSQNYAEVALLGLLSKILDQAIQNLQNCGIEQASLLKESSSIKQRIASLQHTTSVNVV